jgi:hypothetical protein
VILEDGVDILLLIAEDHYLKDSLRITQFSPKVAVDPSSKSRELRNIYKYSTPWRGAFLSLWY